MMRWWFWQKTYDRLPTTAVLPEGTFTGTVVAAPSGLAALARRVWKGKVFAGDVVVNRVLGHLWFEGRVSLRAGIVVIVYPSLGGLTDELKPMPDGRWLGRLVGWRGRHVWFTLERE